MVAGLSVSTVGLFTSTIVLAFNREGDAPAEVTEDVTTIPSDTAVPAPATPVNAPATPTETHAVT